MYFSQPSIKDGAIVWEDSPLVKAAREGQVLVVGTLVNLNECVLRP